MRNVKLYSGTTGLNNKTARHRLYSADGIVALESADNVLVDRTGEVVSARAASVLLEGEYHSAFEIDGGFYCIEDRVSDSALMLMIDEPDGSLSVTGVRSGLTRGANCSYVGLSGNIFYSNGYERGVLSSGSSTPWATQNWPGPETSTPFESLPVGSHIDIISGRMVSSVGDSLHISEHGLLNLHDSIGNVVRIDREITMVKSVQAGLFISDRSAIYFMGGTEPKQFTLKRVAGYHATGVAQHLINPSLFGLETYSLAAIIATANGPCLGLQDGTFLNLIDKNVTLPEHCGSGAITVVDETTILQS